MFPKVQKGQRFQPSASMHNAVVDMLNKTNGMLAGEQKSGNQNMVRVSVKNNTGTVLESGFPVALSGCSLDDMIFEIRKVQKTDTVVAVIVNTIEPNKVGSAVLVGVAAVKVKGEQKPFVLPKYDTYEWQYQPAGGFPVLCPCADGVMVLVGCSGSSLATPTTSKEEVRPFFASYNPETNMVDITGGNLLANGAAIKVGDDSLGAMNGLICVTAENKDGSYENATFKYGEFAPNCIPIAAVKVIKSEGVISAVSIVNFFVSTAVMIETDPHPPCDCVGSGGI